MIDRVEKDELSELPERQLRDAMEASVLVYIPSVCVGLSLLYAIIAVGHFFMLPKNVAPIMIAMASATSAILIAIRLFLAKRTLPIKWIHPVAGFMALLSLINALSHLYLLADPKQTTNLLILIIGVGCLFLSNIWLAAVIVATIGGWAFIVSASPPSPEWPHYGFSFITATALSVIVHYIRMRFVRRIEVLHLLEQAKQKKLEAALASAEEARSKAEVSERKLIEASKETAHSEARFRSAFDNASIGMALVSPEGRFLKVNRSLRELVGFTEDEMLSITFQDITHPEDLETDLGYLTQMLEDQIRYYQMEKRYFHKTGRIVWILLSVSLVRGEVGKPIYFISQIQDITARKQAERRLAIQYAIVNLLAEHSTLKDAAPKIIGEMLNYLNWNLGAIWRVDAEANLIKCAGVESLPEIADSEFATITRQMAFLKDVDLPGRIWSSGKPAWISDALEDENFPRAKYAQKAGLRGAFGFPIKIDGETVGAFEFFSREIRECDDELLQLTAYIGDLIGQFIERKRSERALKESEERYRNLFENSPIGIYRTAFDGRILMANSALIKMLGFSDFEELAPFRLGISGLRVASQSSQFLAIVNAESEVRAQEAVWTKSDGASFFVSENVRAVKGEDGEIIYFEGTVEDITERKKAERALRSSEVRTRSILDNMLGGLITFNERGMIDTVNSAAEHIFGYKQEELVGRSIIALLAEPPHPDPSKAFEEFYQRALGRVIEWEGRRKNAEIFPFEASLFEFYTFEGRSFAGNVRDVSERREVDRLKKEFISTVSHELRTPLTSIRGSLSLLASGLLGDLAEEAQEVVDIAERNSVRLISLINDILDLERLESGRMEMHFDDILISTVFERSLESVRAFAEEQNVSINIPKSNAEVYGDGDRLVQVLVNLLSNSVKFSPSGSEITVSVNEFPNWVEVSVRDRGRGIPAKYIDVVFERFRQVEASDSRQKGGTGLGLAICKMIIAQHKGSIGVESEEGKGSAFWFRVPSAQPKFISEGKAIQVLVCANDHDKLKYFEEILEKKGCAVVTAVSDEEAWYLLQTTKLSMAILDMFLLGEAGMELLEKIRRDPSLKSMPVVAVGGKALLSTEILSDNLALVLPEPIEEEELLRAIQEGLKKIGEGEVLLVDDDEALLQVLSKQLTKDGISVSTAKSGKEAIRMANDNPPGLLVLDVGIPGGDGYDVVEALRKDPKLRTTPLLIFTGRELDDEQRRRLLLGPTRFLIKSKATDEEFRELVANLLNSS